MTTKLLIVLFFSFTASAEERFATTNDSDLSQTPQTEADVPLNLSADSMEVSTSEPGVLKFEVLRYEHEVLTPVEGLDFRVGITDQSGQAVVEGCSNSQKFTLMAVLKSSHFEVMNPSQNKDYTVSFEAECGTKVRVIFKQDSNGGQALGIWQVAQTAKNKLQEAVGLQFWKSSLIFNWPVSADYYGGTVNISRGDHWDVVGHEMGHGIYDLANLGAWGGGAHKIDQCYSEGLALSEGWASFFSAWLRVSLNDADAKFEYLVPRRAPIRFETIPADVCKGQTNEWRVIGFFWDLIDLNADGESIQEPFSKIWSLMLNGASPSVADVARRLIEGGIPKEEIDLAWNLNFLTNPPFAF